MKILRTCVNSILAGIMIAVGTAVYLNCPNRIVGAFLFSIGLITIMEFRFALYTGVVGFAREWRDIPLLILVFLANIVGCAIILLVPTQGADLIWVEKMNTPLYAAFVRSIICGMLIYLCVHQNKKHSPTTSILTTVIAIPAFILCGAEHSIADICFMFAARNFSMKGAIFILVVAIGNAVGALTISVWDSIRNELYKNHENGHR